MYWSWRPEHSRKRKMCPLIYPLIDLCLCLSLCFRYVSVYIWHWHFLSEQQFYQSLLFAELWFLETQMLWFTTVYHWNTSRCHTGQLRITKTFWNFFFAWHQTAIMFLMNKERLSETVKISTRVIFTQNYNKTRSVIQLRTRCLLIQFDTKQ